MIAARRLAKLEGTLTPKAATLLWLTEAHGFPTLAAYVAWLVDQPASAAPLYRVPQAAEAGARAALRADRPAARERAVREAVNQAVFLVELVIRLNTAAEELIELVDLRYAALFWQMPAISAEAQPESAGTSRGLSGRRTSRWAAWRRQVASLIGDVYLAEEARGQLERRYLDGRPALFPDLAADWPASASRLSDWPASAASPKVVRCDRDAGRRRHQGSTARRDGPLDASGLKPRPPTRRR